MANILSQTDGHQQPILPLEMGTLSRLNVRQVNDNGQEQIDLQGINEMIDNLSDLEDFHVCHAMYMGGTFVLDSINHVSHLGIAMIEYVMYRRLRHISIWAADTFANHNNNDQPCALNMLKALGRLAGFVSNTSRSI